MHTRIEDWKNSWFGIQLGLSASEIEKLIANLKELLQDHDQHFHLTSTYEGSGGVGDIEIYLKDDTELDNMKVSSRAYAPGEEV
ncbi:MAG: hypothetical protein GY854_09410 [Deltaproteobacteria bacterium]|nr:hypothetical protein [Deltaproteobacteria bacterium]